MTEGECKLVPSSNLHARKVARASRPWITGKMRLPLDPGLSKEERSRRAKTLFRLSEGQPTSESDDDTAAKKETGLKLYHDALKLNPVSPITLIEYANGLLMLEGEKKLKEATRMYEQATAVKPMDATEWLDVELARTELASN